MAHGPSAAGDMDMALCERGAGHAVANSAGPYRLGTGAAPNLDRVEQRAKREEQRRQQELGMGHGEGVAVTRVGGAHVHIGELLRLGPVHFLANGRAEGAGEAGVGRDGGKGGSPQSSPGEDEGRSFRRPSIVPEGSETSGESPANLDAGSRQWHVGHAM